MKKVWYYVILTNSQDENYREVVAKVKTKGLAYVVSNALNETYKKTYYSAIVS
jgi:hypothetical protein